MHTIGFNGRKLLEAICFEGVKETIETKPITLGEYSVKNLVDSQAIINNVIMDIGFEAGEGIADSIAGYDLGKFLVGRKNAVYISAIVDEDDANNKTLNLVAKGNRYSIDQFRKEIGNYDKCVSCNAITPYKKTTPIDQRGGYVDGAGQLCKTCDTIIYGIE